MKSEHEYVKRIYSHLYAVLGKRGIAQPAKTHFIERLVQLGNSISASRAIEFGCGLGQDALALARTTGWFVSATDISLEMIKNVSGEIDSFSLDITDPGAFSHASYHIGFSAFVAHLLVRSEKLVFYRGAHDSLTANGIFVLLTASEDQLEERRINRYFPSALSIDRKRYLSIEENKSILRTAGFSDITSESVSMGKVSSLSNLTKYAQQACSVLRLIPESEFISGMKRLREEAARTKDSGVRSWSRTLLIARK
jgi:SAM-dependent methyltransferase